MNVWRCPRFRQKKRRSTVFSVLWQPVEIDGVSLQTEEHKVFLSGEREADPFPARAPPRTNMLFCCLVLRFVDSFSVSTSY